MKPRRLICSMTLLTLLVLPNLAAPQGLTSLLADASGKGTLTVGKEEFKVSTVFVKLKEDGTGEITLVTDLQLFVACTWSATADLNQGIDLKITGRTNAGSAEEHTSELLSPGRIPIRRLANEANNTA